MKRHHKAKKKFKLDSTDVHHVVPIVRSEYYPSPLRKEGAWLSNVMGENSDRNHAYVTYRMTMVGDSVSKISEERIVEPFSP